jgi:hypothetical protein
MSTLSYGAPSWTRVKAFIAAIAAAAALTGVVQIALPDSASAMPSRCASYLTAGQTAEAQGYQELADFYYGVYLTCLGF